MKKIFKIVLIIILLLGLTLGGFVLVKKYRQQEDNHQEEEPDVGQKQDEEPEREKELFEDYYDEALAKLETMTLEEKVGQMFLARMNQSKALSEINTYQPGGFVLFGVDFKNETKTTITNKIRKYQNNSKIPLIIAVDEEGGTVTRVSSYPNFRSSRFPSNQSLYKQGGFTLIEEIENEKISLLSSLGINLNLAPVADVSTSSKDYIYARSLGENAEVTSEYIKRVVTLDVSHNFAGSLKHFPGYGNNVDTHTGIAIDKRDYQQFVTNDYLPFIAGIEAHVPTILVSHNIVETLDSTKPASLSIKIHQELRDTLHFSGLIITDDLAMSAITKYTGSDNSAVLAVEAGNDLIITSDLKNQYQAVLKAVQSGRLKEEQIDLAVKRILAFKYQYGLIS